MKQCKKANNRHIIDFIPIRSRVEDSQPKKKYFELQSVGYPYINKRLCLIARNVLYLGHLHGLKRTDLYHFVDLFRNKTKPSLMAVDNFCQSIGCSYDLVLNCDLISEAVNKRCVAPGFNPMTYRLSCDLWDVDDLKKFNTLGVPEIDE